MLYAKSNRSLGCLSKFSELSWVICMYRFNQATPWAGNSKPAPGFAEWLILGNRSVEAQGRLCRFMHSRSGGKRVVVEISMRGEYYSLMLLHRRPAGLFKPHITLHCPGKGDPAATKNMVATVVLEHRKCWFHESLTRQESVTRRWLEVKAHPVSLRRSVVTHRGEWPPFAPTHAMKLSCFLQRFHELLSRVIL